MFFKQFFLIQLICAVVLSTQLFQISNYCLTANYQYSNSIQKQRAFNQGPCSPIILLPGYMATSLIAQIDCQSLKNKNPEIFQACGWNACNYQKLYPIPIVPKKQYRIWFGQLFDKFSIIQTKQEKCLGEFLKFKAGTSKYQEPQGIKITWYGNSAESKHMSNCGSSAISNLTGKFNFLNRCQFQGFGRIIGMLQNLGYMSGINYQSIPYDFRKSVKFSEVSKLILKSINNLYSNTGKKVLLIGHSFGNLHILNALHKIKSKEKDIKIKRFISIAAPYLGSSKTLKQLIAGDQMYTKKLFNLELGCNYYTQMSLAQHSGSIVDLLPRNNLFQYRNQLWFKQYINKPPLWLPEYQNFSHSQILKTLNEPILEIENDISYLSIKSDFKKIIKIFHKQSTEYLRKFDEGFQFNPTLFHLQKPDVPLTMIYSSKFPTENKYIFHKCQIQECFKTPKHIQYVPGDGTVSILSTLIPTLKWMYEKNKGGIKLIDYGLDSIKGNQIFEPLRSECEEDQEKCKHSCIHQDKYILQYIFKQINQNEQNLRKKRGRQIYEECQNLKM